MAEQARKLAYFPVAHFANESQLELAYFAHKAWRRLGWQRLTLQRKRSHRVPRKVAAIFRLNKGKEVTSPDTWPKLLSVGANCWAKSPPNTQQLMSAWLPKREPE